MKDGEKLIDTCVSLFQCGRYEDDHHFHRHAEGFLHEPKIIDIHLDKTGITTLKFLCIRFE